MTGADTKSTPDLIRWICEQAAARAGFSVNAAAVYSEVITRIDDLSDYRPEEPNGVYEIPEDLDLSSLNVLTEVNNIDGTKTVTIRFEKQPAAAYTYRLSVQTAAQYPPVNLDPNEEDGSPSIDMRVVVEGDSGEPADTDVKYAPTDATANVEAKRFNGGDGPRPKDVTVTLTVNGTSDTIITSAILSVVDEVSIVYRLASEDQYQTIGSYAAGSAYDVDIRSRVYENVEKVDAELRSLVISNPRGGEVRAGFDFAEDSSEREAVFRRQRQVVIYPP